MDYLEISELYHHGIKGQKWGIRRYQNEDGSLTPEGKAKYGTVENMNNSIKRKKRIATTAAVGGALAVGAGVLAGRKYYKDPYKIAEILGSNGSTNAQARTTANAARKYWEADLASYKRPNSIFNRKNAEHARKMIDRAIEGQAKAETNMFFDSVFIGSVASSAVAGLAVAGNAIYSKISKNIANKKVKDIKNN